MQKNGSMYMSPRLPLTLYLSYVTPEVTM